MLKNIEVETGAWATEFQSQTGELYELFRKRQEETLAAMGDIAVNIENHSLYQKLVLLLDDTVSISLTAGNSSGIFRNVAAGTHKIQLKAKKKQVPVGLSNIITVSGGKTTDLVMNLP